MMYEGAPDWPERDRFWDICERHRVTVLYTAPTAIRAFMKWGDRVSGAPRPLSLRLLGSVGEPINPEAWIWYHEQIGRGRCPIVDTWWQTETGGIMITPLPGVTTTKPGSATVPFPGIDAELVDAQGKPIASGGGFLTITTPWPGMLRTIYGDDERYLRHLLESFPGRYFAGDGAKLDERWLLVDSRSRRRRAQRCGPPHRHDGSGECARRSSRGGRGGCRGQDARTEGTGHRRVRDGEGGMSRRRLRCATSCASM